jgi:hypothetical protein
MALVMAAWLALVRGDPASSESPVMLAAAPGVIFLLVAGFDLSGVPNEWYPVTLFVGALIARFGLRSAFGRVTALALICGAIAFGLAHALRVYSLEPATLPFQLSAVLLILGGAVYGSQVHLRLTRPQTSGRGRRQGRAQD